MPSERTYAVDFRGGNLVPSLDTNGWGDMRVGVSGSGVGASSSGQPEGLRMSVTAAGGLAAIGAYAVLPASSLPLACRLVAKIEFDQPSGTGSPEPWAVALNVTFGNETFMADEPKVPVTCQFRPNGIRLNTPGNLEGDQARMLITPLDYGSLSSGPFTMEHHFCGVNAPGRYSVGYATLNIGPPVDASDQRVYSNGGLSGGEQDWIGAVGVTVVTTTGIGQIQVTLRSFAVSVW